MFGPKKSVTIKDLDAVDVSTAKNNPGDDIEAKKREFLGGDDDDLKDRGFLDSDDEIDFSNFKVGNKAGNSQNQEEDDEAEA